MNTMTVKGFILALTLTLLLTIAPPQVDAAYSYTEPIIEVNKSVNFRESASTSGKRIRYLKQGERLEIISKPNSYWYEARDSSGMIGFVSSSSTYIKLSSQLIYPESNGEAISSVSFRTGPSTSSQRIRYLAKGEKFWVIEKMNAHWYKITDRNNVTGYVSSLAKYVSTTYVEVQETIDDPVAALELVIKAGMRYLGTPYEYGSSRFDTSTFDCSDFIRQIYLDGIGVKLPSDSRQQADWVKDNYGGQAITNWKQLKRGDLMFFMSYKGTDPAAYTAAKKVNEVVTHVGIYLGNGEVLHTYSVEAGGVVINNVGDTNWERRFLYGGQALR